ncbi:hypothetical protein NEPAR04_2425 [Nematocida parisii]|nr:hypothetical protein NEPAR08_2435 [Nematocida parisii]KAI5145351.1 hypothetical protein NEPAR04_2425 [Nematocida parisii]
MISNLSLAVKIYIKTSPPESTTCTAAVEYSSEECAKAVASSNVTILGQSFPVQWAASETRTQTQKPKPYDNDCERKMFLGNLPGDVTEENLSGLIDKLLPVSVCVKSSADNDRKYAFLEFKSSSDRNIALGLIERVKQEGALGEEVTASPAYPYIHGRSKKWKMKKNSHDKNASVKSDQI